MKSVGLRQKLRVTLLRHASLRRATYRIGRSLYCAARLEGPNQMDINGEVELQRWLLGRANSAAVAIDVGANEGLWTLSALRSSDRVTIHACEPVPSTAEVLRSNLEQSGQGGRVIVHQVAIGRDSGQIQINVFPPDQGKSGINSILEPMSGAEYEKLDVEIMTLPQLMSQANISYVDLVKIDTEGFDYMVLKGAESVLKSGSAGAFQFEYNHRWLGAGHSLREVFSLVQDTSYQLGRLGPQGIEFYSAWNQELDRFFEANFVLVHSDVIGLTPHWQVSYDRFGTPSRNEMLGKV